MTHYTPIDPDGLVEMCAQTCLDLDGASIVGVDGASPARPESIAEAIAATLRARGRAAAVIRVIDYLRPASLRLEWGAHDVESFRTSWYDYPALRREVLDGLRHHRRWLPRLWDGHSDRSFRDQRQHATDDQILLVAGPMVLREDLDLDLGIALRMSPPTLRRRLPPDEHWTIAALMEQQELGPPPDIEVRYDHPERPAIAIR
ncbi:hypothetical protein [Gordonia sp. NPDC003950]